MSCITIFDALRSYKVKKYNIINTDNLKFINEKVNKIYIINLKKDELRRKYILVLMKKYKINFTLVIVDKLNSVLYQNLNLKNYVSIGEAGCLISHLWCLNNIIKNKYKNGIILEDDIILHKNFHDLFTNIYKDNYDFLLLGACDFSFSSLHKYNVIDNLYVPNNQSKKLYGSHANYYSLKGARHMFKLKTKHISFFDSAYHSMFSYFKNTSFVCYPNLIVSDISTSNLNHNYPFFSIYENNYYTKCFVNFQFHDYNFIYLDMLHKNKYLQIESNDTYESYITKIIYRTFLNKEKLLSVQNRMVMNFFTIEDIKIMIFNHDPISFNGAK